MNKLKTSALLLLLLSIAVFQAAAQQDSAVFDNIITKTQKFATDYPPEKVYLHFDKPYYAVGDTIWFKGYITQAQNQPTTLSKIVYVDVFTTTDSLVQTLKLPVIEGAAYGNLPLHKENFKQGNYYIRAYTLWMLNFKSEFFFYKSLLIGESIDKPLITNIRFNPAPDQKVNARISFKDADGKVIASKTINWKIITDYDEVTKGKVTTDANGFATIAISTDPKKLQLAPSSKLVTSLTTVDTDPPVFASFSLKYLKSTNDLQFFPEGGEFVAGIPQQIAFKGIKTNGLGIDLKGSLKDESGNKVIDFNSQHLGMGVFFINAEAGKSYTADVTFSDGSTGTFKLPEVKKSGIAIQSNNKLPGILEVKVTASEAFLEENKGKTLFILAQNNGQIYFAGKAVLQRQLFSVKIPKNKLPEGLVQLSLFAQSGQPLSERLVFIKNNTQLNLTVKADKPSYGIKQKVQLTINAKDTAKFVQAGLSLSVVDESKVPFNEDDEITILSSLLLTSELQGYVEKPNYYFNKPDEKRIADLDVLMLTQGFRKFLYTDIIADKYPETLFQPEQGINISGTLRNKTGLPINKGTVLMTIPNKRYNKQLMTSAVGNFNFRDLVFTDSNAVTISGKYNPNPDNLIIMVDGMPEAGVSVNKSAPDGNILNIDSAITNYLANSRKQYVGLRTIREVVITGAKVKRPSHADHGSLSTLGSMPDHFIEGADFQSCAMLSECIKYKLTGVTFYDNNFYVTRDYTAGKRIPMAIFVNGMNMDYATLNTVFPQDIESVEVFIKDDLGTIDRNYGTSGVIVINTKKPIKSLKGGVSKEDLKKLFPDKFIISYYPKGYIKEREFYVPKYSVNPAELNFVDLRTTVYWNPKITTDASGNAVVEFFNADGRGNYRAVLEGTDGHGNIGRTVFKYTVK